MKNLKFNKEGLIKLISTGMVLVTLSNLTGCSLKREKEELEQEQQDNEEKDFLQESIFENVVKE